ncbi:MAG: D-hexose-6-phosphate mutarotase [Oligoflexia bacterium]|nr:D-hexose-6-phosphate mutarotase [Oligoflexia bacterium]
MIERLQELFGITGAVSFRRNAQGFPLAELTSAAGQRVEVLIHGAHVLSWRTPQDQNLLFCSEKAQFMRGKPVRGGVPIIFPQFGKGELPSHGFARTAMWDVKSSASPAPGVISLTLGLQDSKSTQDMWPHQFLLELSVTLGTTLAMKLRIYNCGTSPFYFYTGFHTYFNVADITRMQILGLGGRTYIDTRRSDRPYLVQQPDGLLVDDEVDSIYLNAPDKVEIDDQLNRRTITVQKENIKDLVVWNPWSSKSKAFADLGEQEYRRFVCVEPAIVNQKITLEPRASYECSQVLSYR